MQLPSLIFFILLPTTGVMAVDSDDPKPKQPVAEWTLSNASRAKNADSSLCSWRLTILDEASGNPAETCVFDTKETDDDSCDHVQFSNIPCSAESDWIINGGWSSFQDFMVIIVFNVREKAKAYFGLASDALDSSQLIPKQIEPAYSTEINALAS